MNQSLLLHVVERLEGLVGRLPAGIQKPILSELTPLKDIFLRQRTPRLLFSGSPKTPLSEIIQLLFPDANVPVDHDFSIANRWVDIAIGEHGNISVLDGRMNPANDTAELAAELKRQPADIVFFVEEEHTPESRQKAHADNLASCLQANDGTGGKVKLAALVLPARKSAETLASSNGDSQSAIAVRDLLAGKNIESDRIAGTFRFDAPAYTDRDRATLMSALAREVPNEARMEMARVSRDKQAQIEIAQVLIRSTTAVCTAIGAQPIPLADLPILTTLQLVMVSGIMYVSGRERSLRAATEFVGALGANVGVGMLLREGTRALLKFFPGWGNVVCGMVAGAGTYAVGRAATVFFLEGVSLKDAKRTYLMSRKRSREPKGLPESRRKTGRLARK